MTQSISGLGTGLDTQSIIDQLVSIERNTENLIKSRATTAQTQLASWGGISSQMSAVSSAATALKTAADWKPLTATSSDTDTADVSAGTGTVGGTISFTVDALAHAGSSRSTNTIAATSTLIAADAAVFVAAGGAKLGFSTFASNDALATGSHSIVVTQSSAAATKSSSSAVGASTTIDGTNDTLNVTVNGDAKVLTIAHGTYTRAQLATAVQAAADSAGAAVKASIDTSTNELQLSTTREGSAATIQVTGGNAETPLNFTTDGAAITGTDGKTQVDGAGEQTWNSIDAGGTAVLNSTAGTITATFAGGLRAGSVTGNNVSVGDGSLSTVVANINAAGAGVTATAVQVSSSSYRLQVTSNQVGAQNGHNLADSEFNNVVGGFTTLTAASDAQLTVGTGPGAYTVTSATNSVSNLLPGVTITLKKENASATTITVARDASGLAAKVQALVDAANKVKKSIDAATFYDPQNQQASPLTGDFTTSRILSDLTQALTDVVPWGTPAAPGLAGLSIDKDGNYTFDSSTFQAAFNANPDGMTKLFVQSGTATNSHVTFVSAGDTAVAGTYAINVTTAATQATTTGLHGSWPIASPPTVKVKVGSTEVDYTVGASDTQTDVVNSLNTQFSTKGLALTAAVDADGVKITANQYGTAGNFQVAWDGSTFTSASGTNIAGTINGVAATGSGQQLMVPFSDTNIGGLAITVDSNSTGDLGTITYQPGVAQRVTSMINHATDPVTGYITSAQTELNDRIKFINDQVASMEQNVLAYQNRLKTQFAGLESTIGTLKAQGNWLTGQISSLGSFSG